MDPAPKLSVIVPFYNEEDNIRPMHIALRNALAPLAVSYELLLVDDGSTDDTPRRAREIARMDPRVRVVRFRRNYGQTAAMAAGIEQARGEILVTLDGDLQNDPKDIGELIRQIEAGHHIVVGWRANRQDKLISRKIPSRIANWMIGRITGVRIRDNGCSLKAYRASVIKAIPLYSEMHRFIPAMASIAGPRIAEIKVRHHARRFGQSKYGLSRVYKVLLDVMVIKTLSAFTARPLLAFGLLAVPVLMLGFALLTYGVLAPLWSGGAPSLPIAGSGLVFVTSALILLSSGMLGELVYKSGDVCQETFARLTQHISKSNA